jgi:hypothetical protein
MAIYKNHNMNIQIHLVSELECNPSLHPVEGCKWENPVMPNYYFSKDLLQALHSRYNIVCVEL